MRSHPPFRINQKPDRIFNAILAGELKPYYHKSGLLIVRSPGSLIRWRIGRDGQLEGDINYFRSKNYCAFRFSIRLHDCGDHTSVQLSAVNKWWGKICLFIAYCIGLSLFVVGAFFVHFGYRMVLRNLHRFFSDIERALRLWDESNTAPHRPMAQLPPAIAPPIALAPARPPAPPIALAPPPPIAQPIAPPIARAPAPPLPVVTNPSLLKPLTQGPQTAKRSPTLPPSAPSAPPPPPHRPRQTGSGMPLAPSPPPATSTGKAHTPETESRRRKTSLAVALAVVSVLGLLAVGGLGWFGWKNYNLSHRPALLAEKAAKGDTHALATLGLSHIRGEWGAEYDFAKGCRMIKEAAELNDACGLLAAGLLIEEGFEAAVSSQGPGETSVSIWQRALNSGALELDQIRKDPRWSALAAYAQWRVNGTVSDDARHLLERARAAGYPTAPMVSLAIEGDSPSRDSLLQEADRFAREELRRGSLFCTSLLGQLHTSQTFPGVDPRYGRERLQEASDAGDPLASVNLANILAADGRDQEAYRLAEKAAETGSLPAKALLGRFLFEGIGTSRDPEAGVALAKEAAERGNIQGLTVMAMALASGEGTPADPARAADILRRLLDTGRMKNVTELASLLSKLGRREEAIKPLRAAAEAGNPKAALQLGVILVDDSAADSESFEEGVVWLEKAMKADVLGSALAYAKAVDSPVRRNREPARAVEVLQSLVDRHDSTGMALLAGYYIEGRGVGQDSAKAVLLLQKAAEAGDRSAYFPLAALYETGAGTLSPSPANALKYYRLAHESGDPAVGQRINGIKVGPPSVIAFLESWRDDDPRKTLAFVDEGISHYLGLSNPDIPAISALEEGFRALWPGRAVTPETVEIVSIIALDRIEFRLPYRLRVSRGSLAGEARVIATLEMVFPAKGATPRLTRYSEEVENWILEPSPDHFVQGEGLTTRSLLPVVPASVSTNSSSTLIPEGPERADVFPFKDKFGKRHEGFPVSLNEGVIEFKSFTDGSGYLLPSAYFEGAELERIRQTSDWQPGGKFEEWRSALVLAPDRSDPATSALLRRAESGDSEAVALVGEAYYDGLGTFPKNRVEAFKWFKNARIARHPLGYTWIEIMTQTGEIKSDPPRP